MKLTEKISFFIIYFPNEVKLESRSNPRTPSCVCVQPRARLFSCRDSLLHVLVFIFFSMIPIAPEGHRWRVTRAPDSGALQQDVYRSSCKIWLNICRSLLICSHVSCLTFMLTFFVFIRSTVDTVLSIYPHLCPFSTIVPCLNCYNDLLVWFHLSKSKISKRVHSF